MAAILTAEDVVPPMPVHAVWPSTRLLPAKTQLFIEYLAARLKAERL